ncbi:amphi-Trp domain-containing protein [Kribbella sp. NPDC048915]|uniref:amphi-Trp domain-containing protein n=1 Tax=Kribbella sp. NPDC048915 TaxID=3155148 RepID=UPI003408C99D
MGTRDVEMDYTVGEFAAKLRRLADALESGKAFRVQVAGERFTVPRHARISVEHERGETEEEVEFQLKWSLADADQEPEGDTAV